jgi:hypothetical protein
VRGPNVVLEVIDARVMVAGHGAVHVERLDRAGHDDR